MTLAAASGFTIIPILFALACPLMMVFMMRGMHGGHGGSRAEPKSSLAVLRRQRDDLDRQIEERESTEQTPVGSPMR